ncbi:cytochrome P450 family protein [Streptomyces hirsutus]|uniref:cytochrome P450 family protein n=1 Tax=Streptomyces hirsutus TaxID=35620 RepID=UPI00362D1D98
MPEQQPLVLDPTGFDRHAEHTALRAQGPAARVDILGVHAWAITDPALLKELLTSPAVSKDGRAHWPAFEETVAAWPLALWIAVENMFTAYGADHRRLRRLVAPAFSARRVAAMKNDIAAMVTSLIDNLAGLPQGQDVDLREHLAYPLPIGVISHLMGVPEDQRDAFRAVVDGVFNTTLTPAEAQANAERLYEQLDQLIATKRGAPGDDMTSLLIKSRGEEDGTGLAHRELRDTLLLMVSAGYETTVNVIDQAVVHLLAHPSQLDRILTGDYTWEDVVEETLRLEPAVAHLPLRYAVQDIFLPDGRTIPKGDAILASYAAANRHPDWHGHTADDFDVARPSKDHLAFGHGAHFCLGAPLARLEVAEVLRQLFTRFPHMQLAIPSIHLRPLESLISNGHQSIPVRLGSPAES